MKKTFFGIALIFFIAFMILAAVDMRPFGEPAFIEKGKRADFTMAAAFFLI